MMIRKPRVVLVCLSLFTLIFAANAMAWNFMQAAAASDNRETFLVPVSPNAKAITKVKPQPIVKTKPFWGFQERAQFLAQQQVACPLPTLRFRGWELDAQAMFARTKGKVTLWNNQFGFSASWNQQPEVDFNSALGIPDHSVVGTFSARYKFKPRWSVKYLITPTVFNGSGNPGNWFQFGAGQSLQSKWERLHQQIGLVYDPILTPTSRVGIFADYVRIRERVRFGNAGWSGSAFGGSAFDNDLDMAMAGIEMEKLLKVTRSSSALSCECKAGVAFLDDAVGADLSTGLKYSVDLNNGRSGYVKGGYRYLTYKKGYSESKMIDVAMDGGYVEMGFLF
jgi:hypothetical protein